MKKNEGDFSSRGILQSLLSRGRAHSLAYYLVTTGCCADEVFAAQGCRYDLERFGCRQETAPSAADVLIVNGFVSDTLMPEVLRIYQSMRAPKYILAVGACACSGGLFSKKGIESSLPVDVFVPGCPPRPEAIMNGIITLQEKIIRGVHHRVHSEY